MSDEMVDPDTVDPNDPVLLYLRGRREFSQRLVATVSARLAAHDPDLTIEHENNEFDGEEYDDTAYLVSNFTKFQWENLREFLKNPMIPPPPVMDVQAAMQYFLDNPPPAFQLGPRAFPRRRRFFRPASR